MKKSPLTELLDRVEAILESGFATATELAAYLGKPAPRVTEWVRQRDPAPGGEIALRMVTWAAEKTLAIDAAGAKAKAAYRKAFAAIKARHK